MKTAMIVQARMGSTRLPGKVLREVLGRPLLAYLVQRLQRVSLADVVVIATTTLPEDDAIVQCCTRLNLPCHRGPSEDVLTRFYGAAITVGADAIVRICADSPLTDPALVDELIAFYRNRTERDDYACNNPPRRPTLPIGMGAEIFSFDALETAHKEATLPQEREHVTPYLYRHPERFRLGFLHHGEDNSHHRWTVDTEEDFQLIRNILEALYPENPQFTYADILKVLENNPHWMQINTHIQQKTV